MKTLTFIKYFLIIVWIFGVILIEKNHFNFVQVKQERQEQFHQLQLQAAEKLYNETETIERTIIGGVAADALEACLISLNRQYSKYEILSTNYIHSTTAIEYNGNILHPNEDTCQITVTHCVIKN